MKWTFRLSMFLLLMGLMIPSDLFAQSDGGETPLGDIARAVRRDKEKEKSAAQAPAAPTTVIDNENFSQLMDQASKERQKGKINFLFDGVGKDIHVSAPDVTCNLSFSADTGALVSSPFATQDLPHSEVSKLDGPAVINGKSLQLTVYNGSGWTLREITVGLTLVRSERAHAAAAYGSAKLIPAAAGADVPVPEKHPDLTVLYHIKGAAAPMSTAVFQQDLGGELPPDQEWHWAIVQAQGIPPK